MKIRLAGIFILPALLFGGVGQAHHSFFAVFDGEQTVTVKGAVTEFRMVNPHAMMHIDATDADGNVQSWSVEFDGRLHLSRAGWNPDTFKIGQVLEVTGNPARSGSPMMFFNRSVDANGAEIRRPRLELEDSIEEQRRQRRALRDAQN
ncbi:MAG: DUF6152 family protein [Proteobacteria bacterium]|nr:DUF6152 family protein [Pseudomonadota bacterium]